MAYQSLLQEYMLTPVVTRAYTTACVLTTLAVQLEIVSPFQLYFNPILIVKQYQLWRLITTFLYFGTFGFNFFFNMIFTYRYCRMLEEGSFRRRTADFVMMFIFGGVCMAICAFFVNLLFLGQAFTIMLVYVWSRRNPFIRMNFFGLLNFQIFLMPLFIFLLVYNFAMAYSNHQSVLPNSNVTSGWSPSNLDIFVEAPYLPWVLLGFSVLLGNTVWVDLMGMAVGHTYYVMEDVFPNQRGGIRILKTPQFLKTLFDPPPEDRSYSPLPEDQQPGGFDWRQEDAPAGE